MKQRRSNHDGIAPAWVPAPPRPKRERPYILLLCEAGTGQAWFKVASLDEVEAVADNTSFLGRLLRPNAALMTALYHVNN